MSDQTERLRNDLNDLCRFCGAMPGVMAHDDDCLGVAVLAELEAVKAWPMRLRQLAEYAVAMEVLTCQTQTVYEKEMIIHAREVELSDKVFSALMVARAASEPPREEKG